MRHVIIAIMLMLISAPAMAKSFTDIAFVSPAGSDANNCVWHTPFTPPQPPACKTGTHAASLLKGPGSALEFMAGTYSEHVVINANKTSWPNVSSSLSIGLVSGASVIFDGGSISVMGDGFVDVRGIRIINSPGDAIAFHGNSMSDPLMGRILNENINMPAGHAISLVNTTGVEIGYDFLTDSGKNQSELFLSNSPGYNIHETNLNMNVLKTPQLGAYIVNSDTGLFDVHTDTWTGPTALFAQSSPHISTNPGDTFPHTANVCPATDIATDTFAKNWTVQKCVAECP